MRVVIYYKNTCKEIKENEKDSIAVCADGKVYEYMAAASGCGDVWLEKYLRDDLDFKIAND